MPAPFDLNLRHLRAIALIARHGSMSAVADAANLSQPALAQGLAKIERQLGVALFARKPRGMIATREGAALSVRIDAAFVHLSAAARSASGGVRGSRRLECAMTATRLRAFMALADHGSFAGAARAEGWAQPAIHRAVRDLEILAAVPLVERRRDGVAFTPVGRAVARRIRLAAVELAAGIAETGRDAGLKGRLRVGAMPLCRARLLPDAVTAFLGEAPDATIDVVEGSWRELVEPLRDGIIDLMIGALRPVPPAELAQRPLFEDRLAVLMRKGHPLAATARPDLASLERFPWIVGHRGSPLRTHWEQLFAGRRPRAPIECGSVMTIRGILRGSDCLTLLSAAQVAPEIACGLLHAIEPRHAGLLRTIGVTTRNGTRPTLLQERFLAHLAAAAIPSPDQR